MSKKEMLINYVPGEECRIAIVEDGKLEELYQERASSESHVGNIYKGRVVNVEPSIQAAFIDFGLERNGFLHISDLHPKYFPGDYREETERVGQKTPRRERPPIQKCLRRGQDILVQVIKEGIGTKGPTLTSYLSIPGRYLVMMLDMERHGVSRKVEDDEERRRMRQLLDELKPPDHFGYIIRTAGIGRTKAELKRDLAYLQRLWKSIDQAMTTTARVGELYTESDLVIRTIRDVFSTDIDRIIVDDPGAAQRAHDFLAVANPRSGSTVFLYDDPIPLFNRYSIEEQIETINKKIVPLPSGGSLVIEATEALVAIDVNSGRMRQNSDAETTAFKVNIEAVDEICRQLRLRDLGGVIVNDLIDMRLLKHRREIEQRFRGNLKRDRARTRALPISQFGIIEMTRQRMRPSLTKSTHMDCVACHGEGQVRSPESVVLDVMRRLAVVLHHQQVEQVELTVSPDVAFQLLNRKRSQLVELEQRFQKSVMVRVRDGGMDFVQIVTLDSRGGVVETKPAKAGEPTLRPVKELSQQFADVFTDEGEEEFEESQESPAEPEATGFDFESEADEFQGDDESHEPVPSIEAAHDDSEVESTATPHAAAASDQQPGERNGRRRRRRRRRRGRGGEDRNLQQDQAGAPVGPDQNGADLADAADFSDAADELIRPTDSGHVDDLEVSSAMIDEQSEITLPSESAQSADTEAEDQTLWGDEEDEPQPTDELAHQHPRLRSQGPQQANGGQGQPQGEGNGRRRRRRRRRGRGGQNGQHPNQPQSHAAPNQSNRPMPQGQPRQPAGPHRGQPHGPYRNGGPRPGGPTGKVVLDSNGDPNGNWRDPNEPAFGPHRFPSRRLLQASGETPAVDDQAGSDSPAETQPPAKETASTATAEANVTTPPPSAEPIDSTLPAAEPAVAAEPAAAEAPIEKPDEPQELQPPAKPTRRRRSPRGRSRTTAAAAEESAAKPEAESTPPEPAADAPPAAAQQAAASPDASATQPAAEAASPADETGVKTATSAPRKGSLRRGRYTSRKKKIDPAALDAGGAKAPAPAPRAASSKDKPRETTDPEQAEVTSPK